MNLFENLQTIKENKNLKICSNCLQAIESREGNQGIRNLEFDEYEPDEYDKDTFESLYKCDWCDELFPAYELHVLLPESLILKESMYVWLNSSDHHLNWGYKLPDGVNTYTQINDISFINKYSQNGKNSYDLNSSEHPYELIQKIFGNTKVANDIFNRYYNYLTDPQKYEDEVSHEPVETSLDYNFEEKD